MGELLENVTWGRPDLSALWVVFPVILGLWLVERSLSRRTQKTVATPGLWRRLVPEAAPWRGIVRRLCFLVALALVILAAHRPKWGQRADRVQHVGIDIVVLLDLSRSMSVEDVRPNRLKSAVGTISTLLDKLPGGRVALVPFAGIAFVQCPLTGDYEVIRNYLGDLRVTDIRTQGTNLGQALEVGLDVLGLAPKVRVTEDGTQETVHSYAGSKHKAVVVFTDGEHLGGDIEPTIERLKAAKIPVYTVGVGTPQGDTIPQFDVTGNRVGVVRHPGKDGKEKVVFSELNEDLLRRLSDLTGGAFFSLVQDGETGSVSDRLYAQLDRLEKKEYDEQMRKLQKDQFDWFLWIAVGLLILEMLINEQRKRKKGSQGRSSAVVLAVLSSFIGVGCSTDSEFFMQNNATTEAALVALHRDDIQRAVELIRAARGELPQSPQLSFNEGIVLQQVDDFRTNAESIRSLERALDGIDHKDRAKVLYAFARANARKALNLERFESKQPKEDVGQEPRAQPEGSASTVAKPSGNEPKESALDAWSRARDLFVEVLKIDADHKGARDGLETALLRTDQPCAVRDKEHEPDGPMRPRAIEWKAPEYSAKTAGLLCPKDRDHFSLAAPAKSRVWAKVNEAEVALAVESAGLVGEGSKGGLQGQTMKTSGAILITVSHKDEELAEQDFTIETTVLPSCKELDPEKESDDEAGMGPIVQGVNSAPLRLCPGDIDHRTMVLIGGDSLIVELNLNQSQQQGQGAAPGQQQAPTLGPKVPGQDPEAIPDVLVLDGQGAVVARGIKSKDRVMAVAEKPGEGVYFVRIAAPKTHPEMEAPYLLTMARVPDCPDGNIDDLALTTKEQESNDLPDNAMKLKAGEVSLGRVCQDDIDWFAFDADEEEQSQVLVWFHRDVSALKVDGYLTEDLDGAPVLSKENKNGAVFVIPKREDAPAPRIRIRGRDSVQEGTQPEGFYWVQHNAQSPGDQNNQNKDSSGDQDQDKKKEEQNQDSSENKKKQEQPKPKPSKKQQQQALEQLLQDMDRNPRNLEADEAMKKAKGVTPAVGGQNW